MIRDVELARRARKQLEKVPQYVAAKLLAWVDDVETRGLEEVRKVPGYNDHPLKGPLEGKRAIRLSHRWRMVYEVKSSERGRPFIEFVEVQEVHPHDY